ncbi:glutathione transferase GstA [Nitrospirillum viridazoti]|uniref:Glutathione S-transferase n=1 Tax=Nitrospirillum amazonense TaxID=28077 RepID=A0A560IXB2_9PROT|nr:glutathione transferase GstA [Nitrospirillum amazonense]TWB63682.1 glutathione S-transferase [Nitrospirillum amazonense]
MKLYYKAGACSLSPHIVALEAGLDIGIEAVDLKTKVTETGANFLEINPKGSVPALVLDDGSLLTEGAVIVQYLADRAPASGLIPAAGSLTRYKVQEWLNFIATELHKGFSPLFNPATPDDYKAVAKQNLDRRFTHLERTLADGRSYLTGETFTVADAYAYVVLTWAAQIGIDLAAHPKVAAFLTRVGQRPKVQAALKAEGLLAA